MRIEPAVPISSELERPSTAGVVGAAGTELKLLSNDPEIPIDPVSPAEKDSAEWTNSRTETVWVDTEQRAVFRVIERETGKVVRQIPSDEVLKVSRRLKDMLEEDGPKAVDVES